MKNWNGHFNIVHSLLQIKQVSVEKSVFIIILSFFMQLMAQLHQYMDLLTQFYPISYSNSYSSQFLSTLQYLDFLYLLTLSPIIYYMFFCTSAFLVLGKLFLYVMLHLET